MLAVALALGWLAWARAPRPAPSLGRAAAEIVPVREVDDHPIGSGDPGEVTRLVQSAYEDAIYGRSPQYNEWLDLVGEPATKSEPSKV